jgi:hypothetical protein
MTATEKYIAQQIGSTTTQWVETEYNNYQLTHYQCHYNPATHSARVEEVCVNQYGSMYGIGLYTTIQLPTNLPAPEWEFGWVLFPIEEVNEPAKTETGDVPVSMNKIEEMAYQLLLEKVEHQNQRVYLFGDDWRNFDFVIAWDGNLRAFNAQTGDLVTPKLDLKFKLENCFHPGKPTIPVYAVLSLSHILGIDEYKTRLLKIAKVQTAIELIDSGVNSIDNPNFDGKIEVRFKLGNSHYTACWTGLNKAPHIS